MMEDIEDGRNMQMEVESYRDLWHEEERVAKFRQNIIVSHAETIQELRSQLLIAHDRIEELELINTTLRAFVGPMMWRIMLVLIVLVAIAMMGGS